MTRLRRAQPDSFALNVKRICLNMKSPEMKFIARVAAASFFVFSEKQKDIAENRPVRPVKSKNALLLNQ